MDWTLFSDFAKQLDVPFLQAVNGATDSLLGAVRPAFAAAAVLYVAMQGYMIVTGRTVEPMRDVWYKLVKVAAVAFILGAAAYHQYVSDFFLNGIPNDINSAITGSAGSVTAASFDHVWNKAFGGGIAVWQHLSWHDFGLEGLIVLYWIVGAFSVGVAFVVWLISHILLGLFVAVGPLVLPMFMFPAVRGIFDRWISSLLSCIFLQVFITVLLVVLIATENALLDRIAMDRTGNPMAEIEMILCTVVMFGMAAYLVFELPGAATALAGGVHFHTHAISRATYGRAGRAAGNVAGAGARAITGAPARARAALASSSGSPMRPPPGPSMSVSQPAAKV